MINILLPLLALILTLVSAFLPLKGDEEPQNRYAPIRAGAILSGIALLLFAAATFLWPQTYPSGLQVCLGLAVGMVTSLFASTAGPGRQGFAFGMAVLGAALVHFHIIAGDSIGPAQLALVVGCFVGAFAAGGMRPGFHGGHLAVLGTLLVTSVDFLGRMGEQAPSGSEAAGWTGVALGLCLLVAHVVAGIFGRVGKGELVPLGLGFIAIVLSGYLACLNFLGSATSANLWLGGAVVGGVVHLILAGETKPESFRFVLSTVIWLAAASIAFGIDQGFGMAIAAIAGAGVLILAGNVRGLMTLGVVAAVLVYRLFRELFPDETRALDIGQHYTMIGIAIGALLPLLPIEWSREFTLSGWRKIAADAVWFVAMLGLPIAAAVLLGSKGAIGMIVGLSFAATIEGLRARPGLSSLGIAAGLGSLTVLSYSWLGDWSDPERSAKVKGVLIIGAVALALAAALFGLTRNQATEPDQA